MEWIPCEEQEVTLGSREGHCGASLLHTSTGEEWVMCVGGYCEGERDGIVVVTKVSQRQPQVLRWIVLADHDSQFECDGASLTRVGDDGPAAFLFGGLDVDMNRCNRLLRLRLSFTEDSPSLSSSSPALEVENLQTTGSIPPPRTQHSAGGTATHLFVFGGETDFAEQTNDLHMLDVKTLVWTRINADSRVPPPRLLAGPLIFLAPHLCVLYGGAHFINGNIKSLDDVWSCDLSSACKWTPVQCDSNCEKGVIFPRSNGHAGGLLHKGEKTTAVFVGGKDAAEGCDKVKQIDCTNMLADFSFQLSLVEPTCREHDVEGPHWRYTPVAVETRHGLLLLGGQCRHPQDVVSFYLSRVCKC